MKPGKFVISIIGTSISIVLIIISIILIIKGNHHASTLLLSLALFTSNGALALDAARDNNRRFYRIYLLVTTIAGISFILGLLGF